MFKPVKPDVSLPKLEEEVLTFWDQNKVFEKSLDKEDKSKSYSFYDGPPFATGLPHYGHLMASTQKDIVPRFWTMKGYRVDRRFGWDCHGLPVEFEINKTLKLDTRKQILELGIDKYNSECRKIVQRYSTEWKTTIRRLGRFVDMENAYFTMSTEFMQSVWWVFKSLFEKGLIYEGYKVVPYSTGISTPLSNFEANLNYKEVQDPAITVSFPLIDEPEVSILAWTTTPWTLPSNLGLAVHEETTYVRAKEVSSGKVLILAKDRLASYAKEISKDFEIQAEFLGKEILGKKYKPLFEYFSSKEKEGAFKVIHSGHVTTESGTGVVHMAPAFGEDDFFACQKNGIPMVNPVDDDGKFTSEIPDHEGKRVKDADKDIIKSLKDLGRLYKQDTLVHSYPYCWRSDTPLIYRAVSSWFVAVEKIKEDLLKNNKTTNWVPDHLRDGRFGNWLENARDWAISRNRFWGTPIPVWKNAEGETICVGSRDELEKLTRKKIDDLHMDTIDQYEIPSPTGKSPLRRTESVLDCWFESGSMPYAQWGYPYQNEESFEKNFPADFIAEGLDQTRGWFYTLMIIGTALSNKAPFRNVIVNGMILAEDGKKMSKSLRNYPDPMEVLNEHGADALRLYLIDSPVVRAQELRFSDKGVRDVVRKILLRWWNSYSFFINYANIDKFEPKLDSKKSKNILDQWVLSKLHSLIQNTDTEMKAYKLYNVVPALLQFIEELTNTYIRFNRSHFWKEGMPEDKQMAYETLYEVLVTLSKVMAPFSPFLSEVTYQNLSSKLKNKKESVHLEDFPEVDQNLIKPELEKAVSRMEVLVTLGRNQREKEKIKAKIPFEKAVIIHREKQALDELKKLEAYFQDELNVKSVEYAPNEDDFVQVSAVANFKKLGARLGPKMKLVAGKVSKLSLDDILKLEAGGAISIEGEEITKEDVEIRRAAKKGFEDIQVDQKISLRMIPFTDPVLKKAAEQEGLAREVVRKIQAARKSADFNLDDRISLELHCEGEVLEAVQKHQEMIQSETLSKNFKVTSSPSGSHEEEAELEEGKIKLGLSVLKS